MDGWIENALRRVRWGAALRSVSRTSLLKPEVAPYASTAATIVPTGPSSLINPVGIFLAITSSSCTIWNFFVASFREHTSAIGCSSQVKRPSSKKIRVVGLVAGRPAPPYLAAILLEDRHAARVVGKPLSEVIHLL